MRENKLPSVQYSLITQLAAAAAADGGQCISLKIDYCFNTYCSYIYSVYLDVCIVVHIPMQCNPKSLSYSMQWSNRNRTFIKGETRENRCWTVGARQKVLKRLKNSLILFRKMETIV